jgi:hypothetical protein
VADDENDVFHAGRAEVAQDVVEDRPAEDLVEDLGAFGLHPDAFSGGQDDGLDVLKRHDEPRSGALAKLSVPAAVIGRRPNDAAPARAGAYDRRRGGV